MSTLLMAIDLVFVTSWRRNGHSAFVIGFSSFPILPQMEWFCRKSCFLIDFLTLWEGHTPNFGGCYRRPGDKFKILAGDATSIHRRINMMPHMAKSFEPYGLLGKRGVLTVLVPHVNFGIFVLFEICHKCYARKYTGTNLLTVLRKLACTVKPRNNGFEGTKHSCLLLPKSVITNIENKRKKCQGA